MNLTQISAFRAVMTSRSLTEAARKIGRTQPAVSLAIKSLEEDLGLKLFERKGRQLVPMPEAAYLLSEAEGILDRLNTVSRTMRSLAGGETGTLRTAAMPGPAALLFPKFIAENIAADNGIRVSISSRSSHQIQELAGAQSIDFGFGDAPPSMPQNAQFTTRIVTADCFCALHQDHPLVAKRVLSPRDLDGVPMGTMQQGHPHFVALTRYFAQQDLALNRLIESQTFLPLVEFVRARHCLAIVDPLTVATVSAGAENRGNIVFRGLQRPVRYSYAMFFPNYRPLSRLARNLADLWIEELLDLLQGIGANPVLGD